MKLTEAQRAALSLAATRRPVAGNDDGWVSLRDLRRPTIASLVRLGLLESFTKGPTTTGTQMHRPSPAGLAALREDGK